MQVGCTVIAGCPLRIKMTITEIRRKEGLAFLQR